MPTYKKLTNEGKRLIEKSKKEQGIKTTKELAELTIKMDLSRLKSKLEEISNNTNIDQNDIDKIEINNLITITKKFIDGKRKDHKKLISTLNLNKLDLKLTEIGIPSSTLNNIISGNNTKEDNIDLLAMVLGLESADISIDGAESGDIPSEPGLSDPTTDSDIGNLSLPTRHNLPFSGNFIEGRENEIKQLESFLTNNKIDKKIIGIFGIGGIGKTVLVLKAAHNMLAKEDFDLIVFTTAREKFQTEAGSIGEELRKDRNLHEIIWTIADTCGFQLIKELKSLAEQTNKIIQLLKGKKSLIIIDNFDVIKNEDRGQINTFLEQISVIAKIIITSREFLEGVHEFIDLPELSKTEAANFLQRLSSSHNLMLEGDDFAKIYQVFGGIPFALKACIGELSVGIPLNLITTDTDISKTLQTTIDYCLSNLIELIINQPAYQLFRALAIFNRDATLDAIVFVSGLDNLTDLQIAGEMSYLWRLSLVEAVKENISCKVNSYSLISLTREYIRKSSNFHEFESAAYERRYNFYLNLADTYGHDDWINLNADYVKIDQNWFYFKETLDWCLYYYKTEEYITKAFELWKRINNYSNLFGHWDKRKNELEQLHTLLIELPEEKKDLNVLIDIKLSLSWSYILKADPESRNLESALSLLNEIRQLIDNNDDKSVTFYKIKLELHSIFYYTKNNDLNHAMESYERGSALFTDCILEAKSKNRLMLYFDYFKGEIFYRKNELTKARSIFCDIIFRSKESQPQLLRIQNYATNSLAKIEIDEGNLREAEQLLYSGLEAAEKLKEDRRIALYYQSLSKLEEKFDKYESSRKFNTRASKIFVKLNDFQKISETKLVELRLESMLSSST